MSPREVAQLLRLVQQLIRQAEASTENTDDRLFRRVIAYLWLAHDELELVSAQPAAKDDAS
jgi:hypothetical protein